MEGKLNKNVDSPFMINNKSTCIELYRELFLGFFGLGTLAPQSDSTGSNCS